MRKDATEFRQRFLRWKNGEQVYDKGRILPHYEGGEDTYYGSSRIEPITGEAGNLGGITVYGKKPKYNYLKEWPGKTKPLNFSNLGKGIEAATAGFFPNPVLLADDIINGRDEDAFHHTLRDLSFISGPIGKMAMLGLGITSLAGENGILKTVREFKKGNTLGGTASLLGDILNAGITIYSGKELNSYANNLADKIVNATLSKRMQQAGERYAQQTINQPASQQALGVVYNALPGSVKPPLLPVPKIKRMGKYPTQNEDVISIRPKTFEYDNTPVLAENPRSKYVDSEGNVNMRNVVKLVRQFYNTHPEARNYKDIWNYKDLQGTIRTNLYDHIKGVVKSAQEAPVPEGYTRQQLVLAALFHDIGKVLNPERSHDRTSVHLMHELGILTDLDVEDAISRHMSKHLGDQDPLSKALHFVDVLRGQPLHDYTTATNSAPLVSNPYVPFEGEYTYRYPGMQEGGLHAFLNLLYPGAINPPKIRPLYHDNTEWLLRNIINPILDLYGYELTNEQRKQFGLGSYVEGDPQIPYDIDPQTARQMVMEFIKMHRTFGRGQHKHTKDDFYNNFVRDAKKALGLKSEDPITDEQLYKVGAEFIKTKNTANGTVGLSNYLEKYELRDKDYQALYNATRDQTVNYYKDRGGDEAGPVYITLMNINDNPDWSLAELWANNEFPIIYSPGGYIPASYYTTEWRRMDLPFRLNTGESLEDLYKNQEALQENKRLLLNARDAATLVADLESEKYKIKYSDTRPTRYLEAQVDDAHVGYGELYLLNRFNAVSPKIFERINANNAYTRQHDLQDIVPPMKSDILSKRQTVKYPVSYMKYSDILDNIHYIFDDNTSKNISVNGAVLYFLKHGLITEKQASACLKAHKHGGDWKKYLGGEKTLLKKAQSFYFKDIRQSRKKDAFLRRLEVERANLTAFLRTYNDVYVPPKLNIPKSKYEIMKDYDVLEDLNYISPDGYRVFSTETIGDPNPLTMGGNHYVIVGKRGSKQMNVVGEYNKPSGFNGNTHGGQQIPGWSRNFGSVIPWLILGGLGVSNYHNNDKR